MGLAAEPDNSEAPLVTMLKKKGKRIIENADEVVAHLQAAFPWARFNTLDGDAVASMSIKEQVLLLLRAPGSACSGSDLCLHADCPNGEYPAAEAAGYGTLAILLRGTQR